MARLRQAKRRVALVTALADVTGAWPLDRITATLSILAENSLNTTVQHLLLDAQSKGLLRLNGDTANAGYFILGMGKLGARELNYSSDIDLIALYDGDKAEACGLDTPGQFFVRLTRELVKMMNERTADGYVFRTDLRLRPDPGSTPLAMSVLAAETYYESVGQNWERAAMIKARTVAGDQESGAAFLKALVPYVWRKSLDFAAIQDIHSIKRQINAYRGGGTIAVHGHNIKLGRGGIREIEFFAQTQQLIYGGRMPGLRVNGTVAALRALTDEELIEPRTAQELVAAYGFLRRVEHRLQMIADEQTHSLPSSDEKLHELAIFLGYDSADSFTEELLQQLRLVEGHYAHLFEDAPSLSGPGNLVFTGAEDDPDTIATLRSLGFADASRTAAMVRQWHHGRYRATITARSRELLTELVPTILKELGTTADPDGALMRFDAFMARLPAGIQLFSLFYANPGLLRLVATIMGSAPRLAEHLGRKPALFDALLHSDMLDSLPDEQTLRADLAAQMKTATDFQDALDITRRWMNDRRFQIGVQLLTRRIDQDCAGPALTAAADAVLNELIPRVQAEFAKQHGEFAGPSLAVVALGKLGSGEMTATSDIDLMFVYDIPQDIEESDGEKPLPPIQYYTRLSQRIINAVTALTNEGVLFEVDMRLRPSGNAGPLASSLKAFEDYQAASAWTWEHMALARARLIAGPPGLTARLEQSIKSVLTRPRDANRLLADVADMRARIAKHNKAKSIWDFKYFRGGLFDIDFIAQYLLLRHAPAHPDLLLRCAPDIVLAAARHELIEGQDATLMADAYQLWQSLQALLRLTMAADEGEFDEAAAPPGLQ
ncbi:MAG: bifunctional [glutamine synthetase] adenylyltransferase/[glutamine synthetase]-adenylyl-L-tyrosine phosphorylase, partial [Rhodospirillales bacterium]